MYKPAPQRVADPPAYQPSTASNPKVQLKPANNFRLETRPAPPVYRPTNALSSATVASSLQTTQIPHKTMIGRQIKVPALQLKHQQQLSRSASPSARPAPGVYRPQLSSSELESSRLTSQGRGAPPGVTQHRNSVQCMNEGLYAKNLVESTKIKESAEKEATEASSARRGFYAKLGINTGDPQLSRNIIDNLEKRIYRRSYTGKSALIATIIDNEFAPAKTDFTVAVVDAAIALMANIAVPSHLTLDEILKGTCEFKIRTREAYKQALAEQSQSYDTQLGLTADHSKYGY